MPPIQRLETFFFNIKYWIPSGTFIDSEGNNSHSTMSDEGKVGLEVKAVKEKKKKGIEDIPA